MRSSSKNGAANDIQFPKTAVKITANSFFILANLIIASISITRVKIITKGRTSQGRVLEIQCHEEFAETGIAIITNEIIIKNSLTVFYSSCFASFYFIAKVISAETAFLPFTVATP